VARTTGERLAAILVMVINRNDEENRLALKRHPIQTHILAAGDFLPIVQPFLDLAEVHAQKKLYQLPLPSPHELDARETAALSTISELVHKLEAPFFPESP